MEAVTAIFKRAWQQTSIFLSWNVPTGLAGFFLLVTTLVGRYIVLGRNEALRYGEEIVLDAVITGALFVFVLFLVNLIRAPILIISEQKNRLHDYEGELVATDIAFEPVNAFNEIQINLRVYNKGSKDLTDCKAELKEFVEIADKSQINIAKNFEPENCILRWVGGLEKRIIEYNDHALLEVAKAWGMKSNFWLKRQLLKQKS